MYVTTPAVFLLLLLAKASGSEPRCQMPGYCAEGASIVGFDDARSDFCDNSCAFIANCTSFYSMEGRTTGCYLLSGECTKFVPVDDVVDPVDGTVTMFRFSDMACFD